MAALGEGKLLTSALPTTRGNPFNHGDDVHSDGDVDGDDDGVERAGWLLLSSASCQPVGEEP